MKLGKFEEAVTCFDTLIKMNYPNDGISWNNKDQSEPI